MNSKQSSTFFDAKTFLQSRRCKIEGNDATASNPSIFNNEILENHFDKLTHEQKRFLDFGICDHSSFTVSNILHWKILGSFQHGESQGLLV